MVSISMRRPVAWHMDASQARRSCCSKGSPPVNTTRPVPRAVTSDHTCSAVIRRDQERRSNREASQVSGVSHQLQFRLHRDRRTKTACCPADGPSP